MNQKNMVFNYILNYQILINYIIDEKEMTVYSLYISYSHTLYFCFYRTLNIKQFNAL